jgi:hypothetical protein
MEVIIALVGLFFLLGGFLVYFLDRDRHGQLGKVAAYVAAAVSATAGIYLGSMVATQSQAAADQKALIELLEASRNDIGDIAGQIAVGRNNADDTYGIRLAKQVSELSPNLLPQLAQDSAKLSMLESISGYVIRANRIVSSSYLELGQAAADLIAADQPADAVGAFKAALDRYQADLDFAAGLLAAIAEAQDGGVKNAVLFKEIGDLFSKRRDKLFPDPA